MTIKLNDIRVSIEDLLLDPNNYRVNDDIRKEKVLDAEVITAQKSLLLELKKQKLADLKDSILRNGFLEVDRIVVKEFSEGTGGKFVVIEGNRRTAALKSLIKDYYEGLVDLPSDLIEKSNSLNVILVQGTKQEIDDYSASLMGIRHVSGPKPWPGIQSARLVNDMFDSGKTLSEIGAKLGISAIDAGRRMRGFKAYLQMANDETFGDKVDNHHYALLLEFLAGNREGRAWLEWDEDRKQFGHTDNVKRVYQAITPDRDGVTEIRNPTDARKFLKVISNKQARKKIESGIKFQDIDIDEEKDSSDVLEKMIDALSEFTSEDLGNENVKGLLQTISNIVMELLGK